MSSRLLISLLIPTPARETCLGLVGAARRWNLPAWQVQAGDCQFDTESVSARTRGSLQKPTNQARLGLACSLRYGGLGGSRVMSASTVHGDASERSEVRRRLPEVLPQLRPRALKLCRDRDLAEDLLQETALRALSFEDSYKSDTNLKAWLHQVLFSVFVTRCRRRRRNGRFLLEHAADPTLWCGASEPSRPNEGLSPPVERAIQSLPRQFGQVVVLVDLEDMTYGEAAAHLGVPIGTVMSRLHRGRRLLAVQLSPENEANGARAA